MVEDLLFQFGFTGFKELPDSLDGAGQTVFLGTSSTLSRASASSWRMC